MVQPRARGWRPGELRHVQPRAGLSPLSAIDARLVSALRAQLAERERLLSAGAAHVGWKLGVGERERIGAGPVIGHLTTATQLDPGAGCDIADLRAPHVDAELALEISNDLSADAGRDEAAAAIAGCGAALELVDLDPALEEAEEVIASNVFHRAFALGDLDRPLPPTATGRLTVDGVVRTEAAADVDYAELLCAVAVLLDSVGMRLRAGDRLITGSIVQEAVSPGAHVAVDLGELGQVEISL